MFKKIIQNSLILSVGLLLGRLSGFIRELLIARKFGIGEMADQIILMLAVPDLLNNILATGAISGMLMPLLAKHNEQLFAILSEFTKKIFVLTITLYIVIVSIFYATYDFQLFLLLLTATISIFPNIITFVSTSYLQYEKRFTVQSLGTLVFNTVVIILILLGAVQYWFALGVIVAASIRMLWIVSDIWRANLQQKILTSKRNEIDIKLSYKVLAVVLFSNGLMFILPIIDKMTASLLYVGSVATLSYAEKIYLLPVSVVLTTYAVALLPDLARLASEKQYDIIIVLLKKSVLMNILLSSLVVVFLATFGKEIVYLIFGFLGGVDASKISLIGDVLVAYLPIVLLAGSVSIFINLLFAFKAYNKILFFSMFLFMLKIVLCSVIVYLDISVKFIAWSSSISSIVAFMGLGVMCFYLSLYVDCRADL